MNPAPSDPATRAARTAEAVTRALVGRTVAEVERDLILDTLDHCLGNRTHAARILGISIRTLRNKLGEYTSAGLAVPEPGQARVATA
jgi:DNA-binding NtrC family response regulator